MNKCLYCYGQLGPGIRDYHPACARKIFGSTSVPEMPYTRADIDSLAAEVVRSQTTVTGVQPKLSLDLHHGNRADPRRFTIVGLWGRYILKPPTDEYPLLPQLEDVTMHMATAVGIDVVPHTLLRMADGELAYLTRRIDRFNDGTKIAMEDMCQLTGRLTEYKYNGSHDQIAKAIMRYSSAPLLDVANYWRQVLFAWLTDNSDMHLKNYSIFEPKPGVYVLTPAYDLLPTRLVMPSDTEELALTLNGKKRRLHIDDFRAAMRASLMNEKAIENIFALMAKALPTWVKIIDDSFLDENFKTTYKEHLITNIAKMNKAD